MLGPSWYPSSGNVAQINPTEQIWALKKKGGGGAKRQDLPIMAMYGSTSPPPPPPPGGICNEGTPVMY